MRAKLMWLVLVLVFSVQTLPAAEAKDANKKAAKKPEAVVAVFSIGKVGETPKDEEFVFGQKPGESLGDLIERMKKAADDKEVKACLLLVENAQFNLSQAEEIRQAVERIKSAGKKVYAHADDLSTMSYALLCGASSVNVVPTGDVWVMGFNAESPYLRGLLDLIGVKPDFITCGAYKSAAEIFMRKGPSEESQQMRSWLLDSLYDSYVKMVAEGRGVSSEKVRGWIDGGPYSAETAKKLGIIDGVMHRQDMVAALKKDCGDEVKFDKKYGKKKKQDVDLSSPFAALKIWAEILSGPKKDKGEKPAVAVVYVEGPIVRGSGVDNPFETDQTAYSTPIRKALDKAAEDDSVKAVVLRVHSPGGSAVASEIILDATKRVKAKKPLVVSMGGVAGSGGYYVACGADTIFADATTITGSIGVVGGKLATTAMWKKIGINWDASKRGDNADMLSSSDVFSDAQRKKLQAWMDEIYSVFKGHVTAVRGDKLKKQIDEIAGGRVYTGRQALELGLVDRIGTLDDAVAFSAKQAKIEKFDVRVIPRPKNFMELLFKDISGQSDDDQVSEDSVSLAPARLSAARANPLLTAALPLLEGMEPQRIQAVRNVLQQLNTLRQEQAVLAMPEIFIGE